MGRPLDSFFFSTWWVIAIFVLSFFLFERGLRSINHDLAVLEKQIEDLNRAVAVEEERHFHAHEILDSFEDPLWIELLLIKNLGLIPSGYRKYVLFEESH